MRRPYDEAAWAAVRRERVFAGNLEKFRQHPELETWLLATGERILAEASPVDAVWGIGLAAGHADARRAGPGRICSASR